jgi:hypothetical protein
VINKLPGSNVYGREYVRVMPGGVRVKENSVRVKENAVLVSQGGVRVKENTVRVKEFRDVEGVICDRYVLTL